MICLHLENNKLKSNMSDVLTLIIQPSAVRAEALILVPLGVPALSWSHATALTPDTRHTHLWKYMNYDK